ncbi:1,2-phenylacetyl-CoA epoxidase subunit PaaC, partial [Acinetobacter variabilis]
GQTIVRQWLMDHYHALLFATISNSRNENISSFAIKSLKEVKYHLRFSTSWMERLSLGTAEAHEKIQHGLNQLWRFTEELFSLTADERQLVDAHLIPDLELLKPKWLETISAELQRFELNLPESGAYRNGAKQGLHTEHLGYVLAELQYMQRSYPGMNW